MTGYIYILGDGRSGTSLLDSILSNNKTSISVGESILFWSRYYKKKTFCSCNSRIEKCSFWSMVGNSLDQKFPQLDVSEIKLKIKYLLKFSNFNKIPAFIKDPAWKDFVEVIKEFYRIICKSTNGYVIDSSKNPNWAYFIYCLNISSINLKLIYIERPLPDVANSWKKKILLPEFIDEKKYMPVKNNIDILRNWVKIKFLSNKLLEIKEGMKIHYKDLCYSPKATIRSINKFYNLNLPESNFVEINPGKDHFIGGSPSRIRSGTLSINSYIKDLSYLNLFERAFFSSFETIAKKL